MGKWLNAAKKKKAEFEAVISERDALKADNKKKDDEIKKLKKK